MAASGYIFEVCDDEPGHGDTTEHCLHNTPTMKVWYSTVLHFYYEHSFVFEVHTSSAPWLSEKTYHVICTPTHGDMQKSR